MVCSGTAIGFGAMPLALFVLEPQHFDDSVGVLVRNVLSPSGLAEGVLLWAAVVQSDLVVLVVVHALFSSRVFCTKTRHRFLHFSLGR